MPVTGIHSADNKVWWKKNNSRRAVLSWLGLGPLVPVKSNANFTMYKDGNNFILPTLCQQFG